MEGRKTKSYTRNLSHQKAFSSTSSADDMKKAPIKQNASKLLLNRSPLSHVHDAQTDTFAPIANKLKFYYTDAQIKAIRYIISDTKPASEKIVPEDALRVFEETDDNGDGDLDIFELEEALGQKTFGFKHKHVRQLMHIGDLDGNGVIDPDEFYNLFQAILMVYNHMHSHEEEVDEMTAFLQSLDAQSSNKDANGNRVVNTRRRQQGAKVSSARKKSATRGAQQFKQEAAHVLKAKAKQRRGSLASPPKEKLIARSIQNHQASAVGNSENKNSLSPWEKVLGVRRASLELNEYKRKEREFINARNFVGTAKGGIKAHVPGAADLGLKLE